MENFKKVVFWVIESGWHALNNVYLYKSEELNITAAHAFIAGMIISLIVIVLRYSGYGIGTRGGNSRRKAMEDDE